MEASSEKSSKKDDKQLSDDNSFGDEEPLDDDDEDIPDDDDDEEDLMDDGDDQDFGDDGNGQFDSEEDSQPPVTHKKKKEENLDPMVVYQKKEAEILYWLKNHPGEQWTDKEFPANNKQFFKDQTTVPKWGYELKHIEWKRPQELHKDPKFMVEDEKKYIDCDAKQGLIAESWFIGALTMAAGKSEEIQKLIVEKEYFNQGFVSFQFFKNGAWVQVIVDTLLPYEKETNSRTSVYCSCANPQEFWISLMEKAYVKLHGNYETVCEGNVLEGLVDITGGVSEGFDLTHPDIKKAIETGALWNMLLGNFNQKFYLGCMNYDAKKSAKTADQGPQGILENHFYNILDLREFPKENLKLVRIRNPWGSDGVWNGAFCEDSDDWDKHRTLKEELKNVFKTKKSDGAWWMSFQDWCQQFNKVYVGKVFPENWQTYCIQGKWEGKTNGGRCPERVVPEKPEGKENKKDDHLQQETDDRWFNNPQFRIRVAKDTKVYISLMLEDEKISKVPYIPCNFMVISTKSRTERIWERPDEADIIVQSNAKGLVEDKREITEVLTLKRQEGKNYGIYMIIPNIVDIKEGVKKDDKRIFYMRLFASESIDIVEMPETMETTVDGQWTDNSAGGRRKIEGKENPNWCRNPQYFLNFSQPTMLKIILRRMQGKKAKAWKVGMTITRFDTGNKPIEKVDKKIKNTVGNNLQRLLQQTSEYLEPPVMDSIERKLLIPSTEKFKESNYSGEEASALFFKWNPTEGPFTIIPTVDLEGRTAAYKLTIFSNNPIELKKLDEHTNSVLIGRWEKDLSAGGCHLYDKEKEPQRTWAQNPKFHLQFKYPQNEEGGKEFSKIDHNEPITQANIKITLAIAEKNWKKENPNTVGGMIGIYLLEKRDTKLVYSEDIVVKQTNFLPVSSTTLECEVGTQRELNKAGYIIMPSTYQSKIHGSFILSVKSDKPFELTAVK